MSRSLEVTPIETKKGLDGVWKYMQAHYVSYEDPDKPDPDKIYQNDLAAVDFGINYIAQIGDMIIGHCRALPLRFINKHTVYHKLGFKELEEYNVWVISGIGVNTSEQGQGIGSSLLNTVTGEILDSNRSAIILAGIKSGNEASLRMFEKSGFNYLNQINSDDGPMYLMELDGGR